MPLPFFVLTLFLEDPVEGATEDPSILPVVLIIMAIFWFVMIAPEKKKRKQRQAMVGSLQKGDKVMTTTGMYATVAQIQGDIATLQIADGVRVKFSLAAVQGLVGEDEKKSGDGKDKASGAKENGDKDDYTPSGEDSSKETVSSSS